ncbi:hypothetical protein Vqi01_55320 [Micromonospora qiuiae]|uniref:HTH tetR-type domain-containing protein n=1 Tax=Micromonospora qiuiae TaxID=502268 RepID=A0ABQ4JID5_9ACTN|nr:TetR/AcrR family transcriptional regulator [Micromonospora qiuiae]GIJ30370.1 hypothetical protein Vqi01_55320 [Micromonospora qiuiae]
MPKPPRTRAYHSPIRAEHASHTRATIINAARQLLITEGFNNTTVRKIADKAGVNVDTIYRSVGRKPEVVRAVLEAALSGLPEDVPAEQRQYVQRIREAATAEEKINIYATAITEIQQRLAPIYRALEEASRSDEGSRSLWNEISERRARNMREFAADLRRTGELRDELDDDTVADIIWSMNSTEYWIMLVEQRRWPANKFRDWLADAWCRLLLAPAKRAPPAAYSATEPPTRRNSSADTAP